jgi:hypothetical protein
MTVVIAVICPHFWPYDFRLHAGYGNLRAVNVLGFASPELRYPLAYAMRTLVQFDADSHSEQFLCLKSDERSRT